MKTKTLLIAAVMFLGLTAGAFAQATYSVGSIPVTAVTNTGLTERTGDITFTQISGTSLAGTITISYGVPITVPFSSVTVSGAAGVTVNTTASNNQAGILVLNVPAGLLTNATFAVSGVRVAVAGSTLTSLSATITTTGNAIVGGQTSVLVIASIAPGIGAVNVDLWNPPGGASTPTVFTSVLNNPGATAITGVAKIQGTTGSVATQTLVVLGGPASGSVIAAQPVIAVKEGFLNAFDDLNPATGMGTGLRFTLSSLPPPGVTITFPGVAITDGGSVFQRAASNSSAPAVTILGTDVTRTSSSTSTNVFYRLTSPGDPTKLETLFVPILITFDSTKLTLPLPIQTINFTTSLWPTGTAFNSDGTVITDQSLIPRFQDSVVATLPLIQTVASTTTLLIPFAQSIAALGYNTGFAISNTTEDPGTATGFISPTPQSGTITFYFFPQLPSPTGTNPTNSSYTTTAGSPGTGLDATGKLPAGSTYTVLLTQVLAAANQPIDFSGYVFVVCNFTNGHGLFVVSNFTTFSQGALALVVTTDRTVAPEALNN